MSTVVPYLPRPIKRQSKKSQEINSSTLKRIMVVDDEPFNIEAVKGLLRVLKFDSAQHVDYGYNGEEAVSFMSKAI